MTQKELQLHAEKYGMTVEQVKEARRHIKPYLQYALSILNKIEKGHLDESSRFLCNIAEKYCFITFDRYGTSTEFYLKERIIACTHVDAKLTSIAWSFRHIDEGNNGIEERIEWLKWQLKNVKP